MSDKLPTYQADRSLREPQSEEALQNAGSKGPRLQEMYKEIEASQEKINSLYERWMEL